MSDPLLERERELARLGSLIEDVRTWRGRVALFEGPAGIGKSRLMAAARDRAEDAGFEVLAGRAGDLEREYPFGVVRQLFEPVLVADAARERALAGAAAPAAAVFEGGGGDGAAAVDPSFAALHGLYWLAVNLTTERPLMLAVDDVHWCDRPSLRFLHYLVRRLEGLPILVAATLRSAEPGVDAALLAELAHDPATEPIRPGLLSPAASAELVRSRLGEGADKAFARACHESTGGNPLLLLQLLRALEAEGVRPEEASAAVVRRIGPRAVSRTVMLRLSRLGAQAPAVARAVAVFGDAADLAAVAALAELDEDAAAHAIAELARAEILRAEPPSDFVHPLVRDALYRELPPGERELLHLRAARILLDMGAETDRVASQLLNAPPHREPWVAELLHEAGRSAIRRGAPESAAAYLGRALEEPAPAEAQPVILFELGTAESLTSGPAAIGHLRAAQARLRDPVARGIAAAVLGRALLFTGETAEASAVARSAAAQLGPELDDLRKALQAFELCTALFGVGDYGRLAAELEPLRARRRFDGPGEKMLAAVAALHWTYEAGPVDECAALALAALAGGDLIAADNALMSIAAIMTLTLADRDEALSAWELSLADAHRRGSLLAISSVNLWRGYTLLRRGELAEAEAHGRTAVHELEVWGYGPNALLYGVAHLASTLLERGELAEARRTLDKAGDPGDSSDGARFWLTVRGLLDVAEGRVDEAIAVAEQLAQRHAHVVNPMGAGWRLIKALALDLRGRTAEAVALAEENLEIARLYGAPATLGPALGLLGTLRREEGVALLEQAVAVLEGSAARLEQARALAALGAGLRRARRPSEAREPLRRALELADVCGAARMAEAVRSELYATGARPRTTALGGVEALTASERRVADLAAGGATNRDIAQALFVTPKTVEVHLSNAYRKLGIRSRRELPPALATTP